MAGTDERGGLGPAPNRDPATSTKDPAAVPSGRRPAARSSDPDQLAADIERTREELAGTFEAIAEKVSPKRVAKRTTKKVASAVRDTASAAAAGVRDTAASARGKATGAGRDEADWAPDPGPAASVPAEPAGLAPAERAGAALPTMELAGPQPYRGPSSLVRPQYVAAGVVVALLAWLLVRRRR